MSQTNNHLSNHFLGKKAEKQRLKEEMAKQPKKVIFASFMIMFSYWQKIGRNGPEETTSIEQGVGLHIEMVTVTGWYAGGKGGVSVQSMGEMGKYFCPNFLQPFLENIDRRSCNDGSRELIPVFDNPHRKCRPSPSAVARTLEYLEGVPS